MDNHNDLDDLRFNLIRLMAYEASGMMATEEEFTEAYDAAAAELTAKGWVDLSGVTA